jgi:hypothetical protein
MWCLCHLRTGTSGFVCGRAAGDVVFMSTDAHGTVGFVCGRAAEDVVFMSTDEHWDCRVCVREGCEECGV